MSFACIYQLYLAKVEKKGRSKAELDQVIDQLARGKKMESILRTPK